ncbi:MAG: response regulator [Bacteroidota bacterium]
MSNAILIVEDDVIAQMTLSQMLNDMGYHQIHTASKEPEVFKILEHEDIKLVLLDIFIKGKRLGIELANHINQTTRTPILFLTASSDVTTFQLISETEHLAILEKPYDYDKIKSSVDQALSSSLIHEDMTPATAALSPASIDYETLFSTPSTGYCLINDLHQILLINDYFCEVCDLNKEVLEGNDLSELFPVQVIQDVKERYFDLEQAPLQGQYQMILKNNKTIYLELTLTKANIETENNTYLISARDITKSKQTEDSLEKLQKLNNDLTHEIHHKIKNNLNTLSGLLYLQERNHPENEAIKKVLKYIRVRVEMIAFIEKKYLNQSNMNVLDASILLPSVVLFLKNKLRASANYGIQVNSDQFGLNNSNAIEISQEICTRLIDLFEQIDAHKSEEKIKIHIAFNSIEETVTINIKNESLDLQSEYKPISLY